MNEIDKIISQLREGELLRETDIKLLCAKLREIVIEESNVQRIETPVTVCGDLHGQFYDLLELFKVGGSCPDINYLFLGDYVNRGHHSIETILLLYALKIRYPDRITLLRGNHESRIITQVFGLYDECLRKYGSLNIWRYITETFEYLTISALIDDKIFCTHGGIASEARFIDDIRSIDRIKEVPASGDMCELLWNDPDEDGFGYKDSSRGIGKTFGKDVFQTFIHTNNVNKIIRAHQLVMEGKRQIWEASSCTTVWSAPNYCYRCGNVACIAEVKSVSQPINFTSFEASQVF